MPKISIMAQQQLTMGSKVEGATDIEGQVVMPLQGAMTLVVDVMS